MKLWISSASRATGGPSQWRVERGVHQADRGAKDSGELEGEDVPGDRQEEHGRCGGARSGTKTRGTAVREDSGRAIKAEAGGHKWRANHARRPLRPGFAPTPT